MLWSCWLLLIVFLEAVNLDETHGGVLLIILTSIRGSLSLVSLVLSFWEAVDLLLIAFLEAVDLDETHGGVLLIILSSIRGSLSLMTLVLCEQERIYIVILSVFYFKLNI